MWLAAVTPRPPLVHLQNGRPILNDRSSPPTSDHMCPFQTATKQRLTNTNESATLASTFTCTAAIRSTPTIRETTSLTRTCFVATFGRCGVLCSPCVFAFLRDFALKTIRVIRASPRFWLRPQGRAVKSAVNFRGRLPQNRLADGNQERGTGYDSITVALD
jgi:hypothetical protein